MNLDLEVGLDITVRIAAIGFALSAIELFSTRRHFGREGLFSTDAIASFDLPRPVLNWADRYLKLLLLLQLIGSTVLIFTGPSTIIGRIALPAAFLSALIIRWRRCIGGDGAEQMGMLIFSAAMIAVLPWPSSGRVVIAVTFIAAQAGLSYLTAGIAKLTSPVWRNGTALPLILSTYDHGHPAAASLSRHYSAISLLACWTVILFETLFPLLVLGPDWLLALSLGVGLAFHIGCAIFMGLNNFLWSFPAAYPSLIAALAYWMR